jgi:hypothetical protein
MVSITHATLLGVTVGREGFGRSGRSPVAYVDFEIGMFRQIISSGPERDNSMLHATVKIMTDVKVRTTRNPCHKKAWQRKT